MNIRNVQARVPGWVDWLPRGGWPVVAIVVMVMCAPGEHQLAVIAGWDHRLAWGMPVCLIAYAGIAATVATRRAKGAQGHLTAVVGAFVSLGAAMAAQPVSHLFVTGYWSADPAPVWLVVSVSCVPPLVLGHLMHVAASHSVRSETSEPSRSVRETRPRETRRALSVVPSQPTHTAPSPAVSAAPGETDVRQLITRLTAGETLSAKRAAELLGVSRATGGRRLAEAKAALSKVNGS
ncbi:hypothetical protein OH768_00900 [Streptomyces sp. NBC_01622]|uniref:hypothetical protein n=1 Tax=Streptomyces sp. NBC_01622 TaxID=2975903 RepID=UPI003869940A|nr:hypothetical protein OH768_00900 [Streptomyces sp. NBC_01622]